MAGTGAYGALQSVRLGGAGRRGGGHLGDAAAPEHLPSRRAIVKDHYARVAAVGLPVVAYNNPIDTKVDLVPELIAEIHAAGHVVGVKEFSGDPRRIYEIKELAPDLDILIGTDDTVLEVGLAGAVGWVSGYPNAIPRACIELFELCTSIDVADLVRAQEIYRDLHSLLRWDSKTEFVQAIKLSMDVLGLRGGICRPPRLPLAQPLVDRIVADTQAAAAKDYATETQPVAV